MTLNCVCMDNVKSNKSSIFLFSLFNLSVIINVVNSIVNYKLPKEILENFQFLPPRHIHKIPKVYLFLSSKPQLVNQKNPGVGGSTCQKSY